MKNYLSLLIASICLFGVASCHKDNPSSVSPTEETYEAITGDASKIDSRSAVLSGSVKTSASSLSGVRAGVICSTDPSLTGGKEWSAASFNSDGQFSVTARNLDAATLYYYAAYAVVNGEKVYGKTLTFTTASIPVSGISLDKEGMMLNLSEGSIQLTAKVIPADATDPILTWSSSEPSVATVSDGRVTPVSVGKTIIAVSSGEFSASCEVSVFDYKAVDLGISVKWADMNIGAFTEEEAGDYFAWGEVTLKETFTWNNYKWSSASSGPFTRYNSSSDYGKIDGRTTLLPEDDAAASLWGKTWRMPSLDEMEELRKSCTWTWDSSRKGYLVTGPNGSSLFLPAAGNKLGTSHYEKGKGGFYWTSSLYVRDPSSAYNLTFNTSKTNWDIKNRLYGFVIRPVSE